MFFHEEYMNLELVGVFKVKREVGTHNSITERYYDSLSMRISGESLFKSKQKEYLLTPKDILYVPQNVNYSQSTKGETIIAIHFISNTHVSSSSLEIITLNNYAKVQDLLLQMYSIWSTQKAGYKYQCTAMLYQLLYLFRQQTHHDMLHYANANDRISIALDYIHNNYKKKQISIADLSKYASLSEAYFRRLFKKIYHVSPNRYIINLRLEYAAQLLQSQLYTIAEVSDRSGFHDVKYFERCFKQKYTETPGKYKKTASEKLVF